MKQRSKILWLTIWSLLTANSLGDGLFLNGVSPRSIGRGGTNVAHNDNGAILFDNPAAAVNIESRGLFEVGVDVLITDFEYSDPQNTRTSITEATPLPQFSLIRRTEDDLFAFGLGVFTPAGFAARYTLDGPYPGLGPQHYKSFGMLTKVLPSAACRLTDQLSIGGTLGVGISHAELEGPYVLQGPDAPGLPTFLDLQATGAALVWSVGLQYQLTETTTLGVTYQSDSRFHLDGHTRIGLPGPLPIDTVYDTRVDMTWPQSVACGIRQEICPHRIVSCDLVWYDWSGAFDDFGIRLTNPDNVLFPPLIHENFPLRWRDTLSVRAGYERKFNDGQALRFGYVYHQNPIPDGTLTPFIQATLEHGFSTGYSWSLFQWDLDVSYMYMFGRDRRVATSDFIGGDFDGSEHGAQSHAINVGIMRRF